MPTDKAGAEITVGCRVAEVDLDFGDGVVESVEVPVVGGGVNIGVKWDNPNLGGPVWSALGGGRAAEHFLVIEGEPADAAAPAALPPGTELVGNTLKPLVEYGEEYGEEDGEEDEEEDEEVDEEEDEEVDEEEDEEEDERPRDPTARRRSRRVVVSDEELEDEAAGAAAAPHSFDAVVLEGARIKMCFGAPAAWYGGLVGGLNSAGARIIGFDDGDLRAYSSDELRRNFEAGTLEALAAADGGVVANETGHTTVASFVTLKDRVKEKTIGVLVGECGVLCEGLPMYQSFHLAAGAFPPAPPRSTPRRGRRQSSEPAETQQDRQGLHTFGRGDKVQYQQAESEGVFQAVVYACSCAFAYHGISHPMESPTRSRLPSAACHLSIHHSHTNHPYPLPVTLTTLTTVRTAQTCQQKERIKRESSSCCTTRKQPLSSWARGRRGGVCPS